MLGFKDYSLLTLWGHERSVPGAGVSYTSGQGFARMSHCSANSIANSPARQLKPR